MTELLPCPFCGGEAELHPTYDMDTNEVDGWFAWCNNDRCECKPETNEHFTEAEAIAAWNSRAVETCKLICHEVELPDSLKDADFEMYVYECSECGEPMFSDYNYCPNCGAKVVSE